MAIRRTIRTHSLYCLRMLKRLGPLLLAATLLAAGCSAEPIPESEKILIESSSSPLGPAAKDGKAKNRDTKPKKDARANVVVVKSVGIRFIAPRGWTSLSRGDVSYAADSPRAREFAERMGVSPEQFASMMESSDAFLMGMSGNLNVSRVPGYSSVPSPADVRQQISTIADVDDVTDVDTPLGPGRRARYSMSGNYTQYGGLVLLDVSSSVLQVTVTTAAADTTDDILGSVIQTLKRG